MAQKEETIDTQKVLQFLNEAKGLLSLLRQVDSKTDLERVPKFADKAERLTKQERELAALGALSNVSRATAERKTSGLVGEAEVLVPLAQNKSRKLDSNVG
jgi:hypothetical protein